MERLFNTKLNELEQFLRELRNADVDTEFKIHRLADMTKICTVGMVRGVWTKPVDLLPMEEMNRYKAAIRSLVADHRQSKGLGWEPTAVMVAYMMSMQLDTLENLGDRRQRNVRSNCLSNIDEAVYQG